MITDARVRLYSPSTHRPIYATSKSGEINVDSDSEGSFRAGRDGSACVPQQWLPVGIISVAGVFLTEHPDPKPVVDIVAVRVPASGSMYIRLAIAGSEGRARSRGRG
jgi:hypothetical protein